MQHSSWLSGEYIRKQGKIQCLVKNSLILFTLKVPSPLVYTAVGRFFSGKEELNHLEIKMILKNLNRCFLEAWVTIISGYQLWNNESRSQLQRETPAGPFFSLYSFHLSPNPQEPPLSWVLLETRGAGSLKWLRDHPQDERKLSREDVRLLAALQVRNPHFYKLCIFTVCLFSKNDSSVK